MAAFGANEWLVDEMYERFVKDPDSVDKVWWDFFDKHPERPASSRLRQLRPAAPATAR